MTDVRVTSVSTQSARRSHSDITHLAGPAWRWTRAQVIASIESGTNTFFTLDHGERHELAIVKEGASVYLRAKSNGHWTDDLLELPECRNHEGACDPQ